MFALPRTLARAAISALVAAPFALSTLGAARQAHAQGSPPVIVEKLVGIVGDKAIFLSDLRARAKPFLLRITASVPEQSQLAAKSSLYKELFQKLIEEELLNQAASKAGITVTSDEVDRAIRGVAASRNLKPSELYKEIREGAGLTEQDYKEEIRRQLLENRLISARVKGRIRITEDDLKATYERMLRQEKKQRAFGLSWIILRVLPSSSPEAIAEQKARAAAISAKARRGEDFGELARTNSDDTRTRDLGGDIGFFAPRASVAAQQGKAKTLGPELEGPVLALAVGQVSDPIRLRDGFAVVKLTSRQPSRYKSFASARREASMIRQQELLEKARKRWLDELRAKTHLEVRL